MEKASTHTSLSTAFDSEFIGPKLPDVKEGFKPQPRCGRVRMQSPYLISRSKLWGAREEAERVHSTHTSLHPFSLYVCGAGSDTQVVMICAMVYTANSQLNGYLRHGVGVFSQTQVKGDLRICQSPNSISFLVQASDRSILAEGHPVLTIPPVISSPPLLREGQYTGVSPAETCLPLPAPQPNFLWELE
jgi:hypothetical protein